MKIIHAPISIGELFDKISVLQIKLNHLKNYPDKHRIVYHEWRKLMELAEEIWDEDSDKFLSEFEEINKVIWDAVDLLHTEDAKPWWRRNFFKIAKLGSFIYKENDRRAEIKKLANIKYASEISEVKFYNIDNH